MSVNKLGMMVFSGFLISAMSPAAPAQSTKQESTQKQTTTEKSGTSQNTGKTSKSETNKSDTSSTPQHSTEAQSTQTRSQNKNATDQTKSQTDKSQAADRSQTTDKNAESSANKNTQSATEKAAKPRSAKSKSSSSNASKEKTRQIQAALQKEGFNPGPIDGIMGVMTMTALRNYQSHNHLEVTGTLTPETETALNIPESGPATAGVNRGQQGEYQSGQSQQRNQGQTPSSLGRSSDAGRQTPDQNQSNQSNQSKDYSNQPNQSQNAPQHGTAPEALGRSADNAVSDLGDVRQVQQALKDLMYAPGEANGMMTSQTQQAIREFQWLNNLPVTGTLDDQTKSAIMSQAQGGTNQNNSFDSLREKPSTDTEQQRQKPSTSSPDSSIEQKDNTSDKNKDSSDVHNGPSESARSSSTSFTAQQDAERSSTRSSSEAKSVQDRDKDRDQDRKKEAKNDSGKMDKDAHNRVIKAAEVLQDLAGTPDKKVPNELLERAEAIAVIPDMIKGAFGIGGRYGKGVVAQRADNGRWSSPSFIQVGGGSFGAQLGVSSTDLVLVFTDRKALGLLEGGKDLKLGVDAGVAAGPVGRSAEAGVNAKLDTAIYAYSRSKGLFAGIALDGAVLSIDKDMNEKVYGASMDAEKILSGSVAGNATVNPFMDALDKVVPKKRLSQK